MMLRKRWWIIALGILGLPLIGFWWVFSTEAGINWLLIQSLPLIRELPSDLNISPLTLNSSGMVVIGAISGSIPAKRLVVSVKGVKLRFSLANLLTAQSVITFFEADTVKLSGRADLKRLGEIPELPPFGALAAQNIQPRLPEMLIHEVVWEPGINASLALILENIRVSRPTNSRDPQTVTLKSRMKWQDRDALEIGLAGKLFLPTGLFEGNLDGTILGKPFQTDFTIRSGTAGVSVTGHLQPFSLDAAYLSRWLGSLWQKELPAALEGILGIEGTWRVDSAAGFSGNLKGKIQGLKLATVGFRLNLLEINADLAFSEGRLAVTDTGSRFFEFPCNLDGKIRANGIEPAEWDMNFNVPLVELKDVIGSFPWALRYGLGLPDMSGPASLTLFLNGVGPQAKMMIRFGAFHVNPDVIDLVSSGRIEAGGLVFQPPEVRCQFDWSSEKGIPVGLKKIRCAPGEGVEESATLFEKLHPPVRLLGTLSGLYPHSLIVEGQLTSAHQTMTLTGIWREGVWQEMTLGEEGKITHLLPEGFLPSDFFCFGS